MGATRRTRSLTAAAAHVAVGAAVAKAIEMGRAVNACVVDTGGNQIAFLRGDGAFLPSARIARDKAWTAVGFGAPTGAFYQAIAGEPAVLAPAPRPVRTRFAPSQGLLQSGSARNRDRHGTGE